MRPEVRPRPGPGPANRRLFAVFGAFVLALAPGVAAGEAAAPPPGAPQSPPKGYPPCTKTPTEGDVAAAKGAFQAGSASFNEADYGRAITYWEDAYRRDCTAHLSLLNLARAYELDDQKGQAAFALETFLERSPGHPEEATIRRRIERLRQDSARPAQPSAPEASVAPQPPLPAPPPPAEAPPGHRSIVPLAVAGAGAAVTVVGAVIYIGARDDYAAARDACPSQTGCSDIVVEQGNDARARSQFSGWLTVGGVAVLSGGLVWYFLQKPEPSVAWTRPHPVGPQLAPSLGAGYGGLRLSGRF